MPPLTVVSSSMKTAPTSTEVEAHVTQTDTTGIRDDLALLAFRQAAGDSAVKYDLRDQSVDVFNDASGIHSGSSSEAVRDSSGKYYAATGTTTSYIAKGGGAGGNRSNTETYQDGSNGGSGGGGGSDSGGGHTTSGGISNKNTYTGWESYGSNGGSGRHSAGNYEGAGGGGGANSAGNNGNNNSTATGGSGATGYETGISGTSTYYSGGGRGTGNNYGSNGTGAGDTANRGGGGQSNAGSTPENGGSGVVIFAYTPSGGSLTRDTFNADGTWTVPANVTQTDVLIVAGGGPGGFGASSGGGGGGQVLRHQTFSVTAGNEWDVVIGAGGVGSTATETKGTNGGDSSIGLTIYAGTMSLVSNAITAEAQPSKADLVMTFSNGTGSCTIGTDLTAEVSRDGSTWTSFGLSASSDQGDTGGHTIVTAHDVDISSQPAGTSMQYRIKTLNQSATKSTRVHAVSLGWS